MRVIGYGTLLFDASREDSIERDGRAYTAVRVSGYRRLFNVRPEHYESSHVMSFGGIELGALNVEPSPGDSFNGVCFDVSEDELARLDEREKYYERSFVTAVDFETGTRMPDCSTYSATEPSVWIERDVSRLLPLWRDIRWARAGAYGLGQEFGREFDRTTFLADGRTRVVDAYRSLLREEPGQPDP